MNGAEYVNYVLNLPAAEQLSLMNRLVGDPTESDIDLVEDLILVGGSLSDWLEHYIPKYAARMLLSLGIEGVGRLATVVELATTELCATHALRTLLLASRQRHAHIKLPVECRHMELLPPISDEIAQAANDQLRELIIASQKEPRLFYRILEAVMTFGMIDAQFTSSAVDLLFQTISESSITLSTKMLDEFQSLLTSGAREEVQHQFLSQNPVLLDPLAKRTISKQKLGVDLITDFVIERFDGEYIIVEIERPSDRLFTKGNDFSSRFTHAVGQVLDFQEWIESNIAYAQTLLPGIKSPPGLLIIGLRRDLNDRQQRKLARFNISNQGKLRVQCFDDTLEQGRRLYRNLHSH